jgi:hypothetical protein
MAIYNPGEEPKSLGQKIRGNYHLIELVEIGVLSVIAGGLLSMLMLVGSVTSDSLPEGGIGTLLISFLMILCGVPLALGVLWGMYLVYIRLARWGGAIVDILLWIGAASITASFSFWCWTIFDINRLIMTKLFYRGEAPVEFAWSVGSKAVRKAWEQQRKLAAFSVQQSAVS